MYLLDFISVFKGSYEKVFLCFPFAKENVKLHKFIDLDTSKFANCEVLGIEFFDTMVIVQIYCSSKS